MSASTANSTDNANVSPDALALLTSQALEQYLSHLQGSKASSPNTVATYRQALERFIRFGSLNQINALVAVQPHQVRSFVAWCHKEKLSPKSIQVALAALRAWFKFLVKQGVCKDNPAVGIKAPKAAKRLPATLDVDETVAFVEHIDGDDALSCRDRAIIELFYGSGLRLSELSALNVADVHNSDRLLRVLGKGRKERDVPLGSQSVVAIESWLKRRPSLLKTADEPALFVSLRGTRLSNRQIQTRLQHWGKKLGLGARMHPHKLRHTCATHFLEGAKDLRAVQELLGHANLSTTQIYTHLDFQHLASVYDNAHPRAKKKS